jgi:hypothetical protein
MINLDHNIKLVFLIQNATKKNLMTPRKMLKPKKLQLKKKKREKTKKRKRKLRKRKNPNLKKMIYHF